MAWIYSVSVSVPTSLREDWLQWMKEEHIPDVLATGYFEDFLMQELIAPKPFQDKDTFNVQYVCQDEQKYNAYQSLEAPRLQQLVKDRYGEQLTSFRTLMKRVWETR